MKRKQPKRINEYSVELVNNSGRSATLFATEDVYIDNASVDEAIAFLDMADFLCERRTHLTNDVFDVGRIILTPDFHRGAGIPVGTVVETTGFVLPKAIGSDIGCGMRLLATDLQESDVTPALMPHLRYRFFEGGRDIALSKKIRREIFQWGMIALVDAAIADASDSAAAHHAGSWPTSAFIAEATGNGDDETFTYDGHLGSIGGGNHFVELQVVDEILDRHAAYHFGLRQGAVTVMCHSGSLDIGHFVMRKHGDIAVENWPTTVPHPPMRYFPLIGDLATAYLDQHKSAVNYAFANRYFLGRTALLALHDHVGRDVHAHLVQDAPHNAIWEGHGYLHRKGACPAEGMDEQHPFGHPVIVPGSMGDYSYVLRGHGSLHSHCSACHGAGRISRRGDARKVDPQELERLHVVTPWDATSLEAKQRRDILEAHNLRLMEEVPSAYKPIGPAVATCHEAGIASPVARLRPLMTIKG